MARQGIGMGRTIWGEARMSATYFNKRGDGHSIRGTMAREQGAVAWSKLPATLRRGLSIRDAIDAEISREWHHAGKYATEVHVYYLDQVEEFWTGSRGWAFTTILSARLAQLVAHPPCKGRVTSSSLVSGSC